MTETSKGDPSSTNAKFVERSKRRGQWANSAEFMLAVLGNVVGLGNIWRFPYLVYKNGGGIFVMVYLIALFIIGFPIVFIETVMAQYSQSGPAELFSNIAPMLKGFGYCSIAASALVAVYYNVVISWTFFYFFEAFTQKWSECGHDFNTDSCISIKMAMNYTTYQKNMTFNGLFENRTSSADEFFNRYVLNKTESMSELAWPQWPQTGLSLSLLGSTVFLVTCLIKGVETSGKAVYFTALYPYVMLTILFIRGITLKGAMKGINFYLWPSFRNINYRDLVLDAVVQVFYSMNAGVGNIITLSSFNPFHNKLSSKVTVLIIGDAFTSIFAGLVVFSMVGFVADLLGKSVDETVTDGIGLVFIVILEGMTQMPLSTIWIFCFISMLFFLGIDSLFGAVETVNTFIHDYSLSMSLKLSKYWVTIFVGVALFIGGLTMTMRSGIYMLSLIDSFATGMPILAGGIGDCVIVAFIYGTDNMLRDYHFMTGTTMDPVRRFVFKAVLIFVLPCLLILLFIDDFVSRFLWSIQGRIDKDSAPYPVWSLILGWTLGIGPVLFIPFFAIIFLIRSEKETLKEKFQEGITSTETYHQAARFYGSFDDAKNKEEVNAKKAKDNADEKEKDNAEKSKGSLEGEQKQTEEHVTKLTT